MAGLVITPEIEHDAHVLAERTGVTPTEAVERALRIEIDRGGAASSQVHPAEQHPHKNLEKIRAALERIHSAPVDNSLSQDEILGYDEFGVPEQPYLGR